MTKFKALYNFTFPKVSEQDEVTTSTDENGATVTVTKKVPVTNK